MNIKSIIGASFLTIATAMPTITSAEGGGYAGMDLGVTDEQTGYRFFGGFKINSTIAIEGGYISYLSEKDKATGIKLDMTGFEVGPTLQLPLQGKLDILARAGITFWKVELDGAGYLYNAEGKGNDFFVGIAGEYEVQNNVSIRAGLDKYVGDFDEVRMSAGVVYNFK
jgi:hypothetical protein